MRKKLFRGKSKYDNCWYEGDYREGWTEKLPFIVELTDDFEIVEHIVIPETVGQFTGACDVRACDIFEGDVLHYIFERDGLDEKLKTVLVEWSEDYCGFVLRCGKSMFDNIDMSKSLTSRCYEIIGNVHDNPELLEEVYNNE